MGVLTPALFILSKKGYLFLILLTVSGFLPRALCPPEQCRPAVCLCRLWAASFVPWNLRWERQLCGRCLASPRCQTEQGGCILGGWERQKLDSGYTIHASVHFQKVCDETRPFSILLDIHSHDEIVKLAK